MKKTILTAMFTVLLSATAFGEPGDNPRDVADRIRGDAVRADNRGDSAGAREARGAADRAERSTPETARDIERSYNRGEPSNGPNREPAGWKN